MTYETTNPSTYEITDPHLNKSQQELLVDQ